MASHLKGCGWHQCPFCRDPRARSSAELWLRGRVGEQDVVFKMPRLVGHHAAAHGYQPPVEVLNALVTDPQVITDRY